MINNFNLPGKVYTMDISPDGNKLVAGFSGRNIYIYDVRKTGKILQKRDSSLKFQTRVIRCSIDNLGYSVGSIEGRIAIEYFDASKEVQDKKYAFKCHRKKIDNVETLYPVNAIAYHPIFGTFASGGADGIVNTWDGKKQKKLNSFSQYPTSISSLSFNIDGSLLAIASSYTFELGDIDHPKDEIYIRTIIDQHVVFTNKN